MDFSLDDTHRQLQDSLERWLAGRYTFRDRAAGLARPEGWSREAWNGLAGLGLTGLPFAAVDGDAVEAGGPGAPEGSSCPPGHAVDVMLVMQAFGRALLVEPFLPSIVMAGRALQCGARPPLRERVLSAVASGTRIAAWAHHEPGARRDPDGVETRAVHDGKGWRLTGRKAQVLHGASADLLVASARLDATAAFGTPGAPEARASSLALFLVDARAPGLARHALRRIDGLRVAEITLHDVAVPPEAMLDAAPDALALAHEVEDAACAAAIAEGVGAMEVALRLTLEHLRSRRQFGVAIGGFQALQHRAADMHVAIEQARSMALYAAMAVDDPDPRRRSAGVSAAKIVVDRAARTVGDSAIQLHGGMGMTDEHPVGHYARKLATLRASFGDIDFHARRLARLGDALEEAA